jgi:tRNA 2-thiouridine synthesizing protein A
MRHKEKFDKILDVKGLVCPVPTVMTSQTLKEMKKGTSLKVITNDMTTKDSIPSLCTDKGYNILDIREEDGLIYFIIRK